MIINLNGAKVRGFVVIHNTDYAHFTIGKTYEVIQVSEGWVGLLNDLGEGDDWENPKSGWTFTNGEFDVV